MNKKDRIRKLENEIYHLEQVKDLLTQVSRNGYKAFVCPVDYTPHTGGVCPLHPDADRIPVREAMALVEDEIRGLEIQLLDLEFK